MTANGIDVDRRQLSQSIFKLSEWIPLNGQQSSASQGIRHLEVHPRLVNVMHLAESTTFPIFSL